MANLSWLKQRKICFFHEDIHKGGTQISTQSKTETQSITTVMKFQLETTADQLRTYVVQNTTYKDAIRTLLAEFLSYPSHYNC